MVRPAVVTATPTTTTRVASHSREQGVQFTARFVHHFIPTCDIPNVPPRRLPCTNFNETAVGSILMPVVANVMESCTADPIV